MQRGIFQDFHLISPAVFNSAVLSLTPPTHTPPFYLAPRCLIPFLVCGMPASRGCPPVLSWHRLQGAGHIWSLGEGEAHGALRARGKLETVMNRSIAPGRADTKGFSEQRICPSKELVKPGTEKDDERDDRVGGWMKTRSKGKTNTLKNTHITEKQLWKCR